MLENILNDITRLPMDRLGRNLGGPSYHVPDMSVTMRLPWRRPLPSNEHYAVMGVWKPNA